MCVLSQVPGLLAHKETVLLLSPLFTRQSKNNLPFALVAWLGQDKLVLAWLVSSLDVHTEAGLSGFSVLNVSVLVTALPLLFATDCETYDKQGSYTLKLPE